MSQAPAKRVLRIVSQLNISGAALQAVMLTAALGELGYETHLLGGLEYDDDSMTHVAEHYAIHMTVLPALIYRERWKTISAIYQTYRFIKDFKPDIVHTHNPRAGFVGRIAARLAGVPVVVHTLHEYPFRGYYNQLSTYIFIYMERFGAYFSDSIITLSQKLRHALVETYGITRKNRISVLPLGFDLAPFAQTKRHLGDFRSKWHIASDVPLIGIIGRLLPVKNHRLFLDAARLVRQTIPDAHFVIVGDGEQRAALANYVHELGLSKAVTFTGWQADMHLIYSDLDVLVNSSLNEGTPVPIIEALTAGCPVVATDVGGVADLLANGDLGALVPTDDKQALSAAIIACLHSPPDMQVAQKTMLRRYDITQLAKDLDSLYRGLLAKKAR